MDKFEYNVRATEIKELIKEGNYVKAADIADTIDWRRVKSLMMLCTISDVYKINRRYDDSRDILLYAHERNPGGRLILYYLCELSIKLGDVVSALEYYKHFARIAPEDASQFILLYKIYEAQDATLEERIGVLEELKRREYKEKWAYELAYHYHLVGQTSMCIDECDEIFLWFGKGKYVTKALELKQMHTLLSEEQLRRLNDARTGDEDYAPDNIDGVDFYNDGENAGPDEPETVAQAEASAHEYEPEAFDGMDIEIRPVDISQYNTINLQREIAENMKELMSDTVADTADADTADADTGADNVSAGAADAEAADADVADAYAAATDMEAFAADINEPETKIMSLDGLRSDETFFSDTDEMEAPASELAQQAGQEAKTPSSHSGVIKSFSKSSEFDNILSLGSDGQISLVVPDEPKTIKQITGQLVIDEILAEWELQKKEIEDKRKAEVRRKIQEQTDTLFDDFDEKTKMGLLEKLEKAMVDAVVKSSPSVVKVADIYAESPQSTENAGDFSYDDVSMPPDPVTPAPKNPEEGEALFPTDQGSVMVTPQNPGNSGEGHPEFLAGPPESSAPEDTPSPETLTDQGSVIVTPQIPNAGLPESTDSPPRALTEEEKARFGRFVQHKKARRQLLAILDGIAGSKAPCHIIVSGEESLANMKVAKGLIKEAKDKNTALTGKVVRVTGETLSTKDISETFTQLGSGIIIIEAAGGLNGETAADILALLGKEDNKTMVILEDSKGQMGEFLDKNPALKETFSLRIDLSALDNKSLVEYARNYAREQEYSIDEFGVLALHTRIAELQTSDHEVTTAEIEEILEEAMYYADRLNPKHFFDILGGKRYDDEDMIILRERDFMH